MKVLLLNGSSHKNGCTYTALNEVAKTLILSGIETDIYQLGNPEIRDCCGCGACKTTGECVIARSLMSNSIFLPFLIIESILNILITIIYFIDGIKYKIKLNCILCSLNILFQPLLVMLIIMGVLR